MKYGVLLLVLLAQAAFAKDAPLTDLTYYDNPAPRESIDSEAQQRNLLQAKIRFDKLMAERGTVRQVSDHSVELKWPLRRAVNVADKSVQQLSPFFDQDTAQGSFQDWNCGDRAYDGHNGVDISYAPYPWYRMRKDQLIVIAAAPGTITQMVGDKPEDSCSASSGDNNQIWIEHDDGSWGGYAHMRTDSLTRKSVGDRVSTGEYLGVVGSAGLSTGPHLHLSVGFWETVNGSQQFIWEDPWAGSCNTDNNETWWESQPPYLIPGLMSAATHDKQPNNPPAPCPESEKPHYSNSFSAGDTIFFTWTIRDQIQGVPFQMEVKTPNGTRFTGTEFVDNTQDLPLGRTWSIGTQLPGNAMAGKWTLEITYDGETLVHEFWVDASPPAPPAIKEANNAVNGLWYDPSLDGEGYNFITSASGTVIFFYGSDEEGKRLWLISETLPDNFTFGKEYLVEMFESTGGIFSAPMKSARGLSTWGELRVTFSDCGAGVAKLRGIDGDKTSNIVKLAAVPGTSCGSGDRKDASQSGLWYNSGLDGEGFNLIVSASGAVIFYYGFDKHGNRFWLISDNFSQRIDVGEFHEEKVYRAKSGTFDNPVPSAQSLEAWGTVTITVHDCNTMEYQLNTNDGFKDSDTVRLAGVIGVECK